MFALKTTVFAALLCIYKIEAQSDGNCGSDCAPQSESYNLTCHPSGTFASVTWTRGNNDIMLCSSSTGQCVPNVNGYNGYKISDSEYVLEIVSLNSSTDSQNFTCLTGLVEIVTCPLVVRKDLPTGTLEGSCMKVGDAHKVSCSGLLTPGTPQVDLQIKNDSSIIASTNTELSLSTIEQNALQNNYSCSAQCLQPYSFKCEETTTTLPTSPTTRNNTSAPPDPDCHCARIAVIILVVLLVVKIATDVFFVGYRWGDKCKQNIDKKRNILYRICFVQGIINSICGVVFIIIICLAYPECLGEALAIAALVISIIVLITGLIYIVMFLCKQNIDKKRNILNWICFVQGIINSICGVVFIIIICATYPECLGKGLPIAALVLCIIVGITGVINIAIVFVHPGDKRTPAPSSPPPIPPNMASPRKPPVPPSSTTPRTLPNPTSDPASDSAVNPKVHLEPLSVEEPKKKKKKRKKRKNINGETSDRPMNTTRDSDE